MYIKYSLYDELEKVPLDEGGWNDIVARSETGGIFLQYNWISAWWHHMRREETLFFVAAEDKRGIVAFAPLMVDGSGTLRLIGDNNSDYLDFAIPADRPELMDGFLSFLRDVSTMWNVAHLKNIPRDCRLSTNIIMGCRNARLFAWRNYSESAPYLKITDNSKAVESILDKYSLRRAKRQLATQGEIDYRIFQNKEEAASHWKPFAEQHVRRCDAAGRRSPFQDQNYVNFLRSVLESDSGPAKVHFSAVLIGGAPIAYHYGFVSQDRLMWYKPSFDIRVRKGSPGLVLIQELLEYAYSNGLNEFDLTIGDEPFKSRFSDNYRFVDSYRIHKSWAGITREKAYWALRYRLKHMVGPRHRYSN